MIIRQEINKIYTECIHYADILSCTDYKLNHQDIRNITFRYQGETISFSLMNGNVTCMFYS